MPATKEIPDNEKTADDWAALPDVVILTMGICTMHVCARDGVSEEEIERVVNREHPTGISSSWSLDEDTKPRPCPDGRPGATHYGLSC